MTAFDSFKIWHKKLMEKKNNRILLIIGGTIYFSLYLLVTWTLSMDIIIGLLLLTLSVFLHKNEGASYLFILALFFLLLTNPLTIMCLVILGMFLLYKWLDHRRVNSLTKIAQKTPSQLSGVSYQDPRVEIIIKGDNRR